MNAISLGWGVQSWTLAAMSALGELPRVDVAIHADTTHERSNTYAFAAVWCAWLAHRVHADLLEARLDIHETYFLLRDYALGDGGGGNDAAAWDELLEEGEQEATP